MESKTKDLTYIAIVLAIGAVLKLLSDLFTRTVLFFLFIDPLLLTAVFLLLKYPKIKVALIITAVQSILGVTLFLTTDMWFIRPVIVLLCFIFVKIFNKTKLTIEKKYMFSCFFSSLTTIIVVALVLIGIVLFIPQLFPMDEVMQQISVFGNNLPIQSQMLIAENTISLILIALGVMGVFYSFIPASTHLFLAFLISKIFKIEKQMNR